MAEAGGDRPLHESADGEGSLGWAAQFLTQQGSVDLTPVRLERRRLGAAMRRVIEALAAVDAPVDALQQAAADLEVIADRLEGQPPAEPVGFAEAANAPAFDAFLDRSPVLGHANPIAPPLELSLEDDTMVGRATFGAAYEGPPGCVHGGWIAAAFDEVLGATQSLSGSGGMTAYLKVDYRRPTPLREPLRFEGRIDRVEGRKIFTTGRLLHEGEPTAEAEALFVSLDASRFAELHRARQDRLP